MSYWFAEIEDSAGNKSRAAKRFDTATAAIEDLRKVVEYIESSEPFTTGGIRIVRIWLERGEGAAA